MKAILTFTICVFAALNLCAQTTPVPVRLAIVPETPEAGAAVDVLAAEFSKNDKVHLLERAEIEKVYREQGMSAANTAYLKLGQILGADGLLLLGTASEGTNQFLNVRLVAVKPGVVLVAERFPWPMKNLTEWSPIFARHLDIFLPKLTVLLRDAIPISVVNLRSAVSSGEAQETERQLKLLTIQRLSREPQLFVLERQQLQLLNVEKELKSDESAFWSGSYLLEGTIDQNGYSKDIIMIHAQLTPPKGGTPTVIEAQGSRTNLVESVNLLANEIVNALKVNSNVTDWNAAEEAAQYMNEAKWAFRWRLYREAQEASESAWALGIQTADMALLRLESYEEATPDLPLTIRVVELFNQFTRRIMTEPGATDLVPFKYLSTSIFGGSSESAIVTRPLPRAVTNHMEWFGRGLKALHISGVVLQNFNESAEARSENKQQLSELRALTRQLEAILETNVPADMDPFTLKNMKWQDGGLWYDTPEQSLSMYDGLLQGGFYTGIEGPPRIVAWSWEDRKRIPDLLRQFARNLAGSTNQDLRLAGLFYTLVLTPDDSSGRLENIETELFNQLWDRRDHLFRGGKEALYLRPIELALSEKFGMNGRHFNREPFIGFQKRLLQHYLTNSAIYSRPVFDGFFNPVDIADNSSFISAFTDSEKSDLMLMLDDFKKRLNLRSNESARVDDIEALLAGKDPHGFKKRGEPPPPPPAVPRLNANNSVVVSFRNWNLNLPVMDSRVKPVVRTAIYRQGKLWLEIQCCDMANRIAQVFFASVDLGTGLSETIPFHKNSTLLGQFFEVTGDSIYFALGGQLERYQFKTKLWEPIQIPLEGNPQIVELKGRIYLSTQDAILEVTPDTAAIQILASARRRPALNQLDEQNGYNKILASPDGRLFVSVPGKVFAYSPDRHVWKSESSLPPAPVTWHGKNPIQYEKDGQPIDPLAPTEVYLPTLSQPAYWAYLSAVVPFRLNTPEGQIVISPGLMGHWLTPKSALASSIEESPAFVLTNTPAFQKP